MSIAEKLTTIAENEQKVYDKGVTDGKKSEYDVFWDEFQNYGNRGDYSGLFVAIGYPHWFKPKYDLHPTNLYMFTGNSNWRLENIDMAQFFDDLGVKFDTSKCTNFQYAFRWGKRYGVIDTTGTNNLDIQLFGNNIKLTTIDELIVKETAKYNSYTFGGCTALANIKITGTIGTTLTMASCPLTVESAKSVINALKNYAGTDKELTYKLTLNTTVWTALNNAETPPTGDTWQEYVYSLGWNYA